MDFLIGIGELIFSSAGKYSGTEYGPIAIFAASSAMMGVLVVCMDFLIVKAGHNSALNLAHRGKSTLWLILLWGCGAGLGGFIGAGFNILELNRAACITTGVSWPLILPRLVKAIGAEADEENEEVEEEE